MSTEESLPSTAKPWNNPAVRSIFFQLLLLVSVVSFGLYVFENTTGNLEKQGIATGFGFLETTAGFGIITHLIEYSETSSYGRAFLVSLLNTLLIAFSGIFAATIIGVVVGVGRLSNNWLIAKLAMIYVEVFRNTPLLLQIFFWYSAVLRSLPSPRNSISPVEGVFFNNRGLYLPSANYGDGFSLVIGAFVVAIIIVFLLKHWAGKRQESTGQQFPIFFTALGVLVILPSCAFVITGFPVSFEFPVLKGFNFAGGAVITPEFLALWLSLSIYTASFIAEIVRAGIQSVNHGQSEAAQALGIKSAPTLRLVIFPQALRVIIPPLASQYLNLTKNSSLATAIAYPDLVSVFTGTVLNQTGQAIEIIAITMAIYLSISLGISILMNWYNARVALVER